MRINPRPPKRYSRKGLIRYFKSLPPRSRPCSISRCPIGVFLNSHNIVAAALKDLRLATAVDSVTDREWGRLTAARIVKIAEGL